jgi:phage gp36-like protein
VAHATSNDLIARYDVRTLGDLCADGQRVDAGSLSGNTAIQVALATAKAQVLAALRQADRYSVADLEGLTGPSQDLLVHVECLIAFSILWDRRPWNEERGESRAVKQAHDLLEQLRNGVNVFDLPKVIDAELSDAPGVPAAVLNRRNLLVDQNRGRFLPARVLTR